jgi:hypothetical protein
MKRLTDDQKHLELLTAINGLGIRISILETQGAELNRRVGIQNGRVADSEAAIKKILLSDSYKDGVDKGVNLSRGRVYAFLTLLVAILGVLAYIYK